MVSVRKERAESLIIDVMAIERVLKAKGYNPMGLHAAIISYLGKSYGLQVEADRRYPIHTPAIPFDFLDGLFEATGLSKIIVEMTKDFRDVVETETQNGFLIIHFKRGIS